jgi:hypothetical protein
MRIRKKASKPSAKRPPLYFIGYRGTAPALDELTSWYDREYGGPLKLRTETEAPESWHASHGPWTAHVVMPLPATHTAGLKETMAWEHDLIGAVTPSVMPPRDMPDTILFAARLARGLTLLTQGTAFDLTTQQYLNPSDWQDRPLTHFVMADHVPVMQVDDESGNRSWCYTLGLSKFGMDELETFFPRGLPDTHARELLGETMSELVGTGHTLKVGSQLRLALLGQTVKIANYRTVSPAGRILSFREIQAVS